MTEQMTRDEIEALRDALFSGVPSERETSKAITQLLADLDAAKALLQCPNAVHVNMLFGGIAKPSVDQIRHIYQDKLDSANTLAAGWMQGVEAAADVKIHIAVVGESRLPTRWADAIINLPLPQGNPTAWAARVLLNEADGAAIASMAKHIDDIAMGGSTYTTLRAALQAIGGDK